MSKADVVRRVFLIPQPPRPIVQSVEIFNLPRIDNGGAIAVDHRIGTLGALILSTLLDRKRPKGACRCVEVLGIDAVMGPAIAVKHV